MHDIKKYLINLLMASKSDEIAVLEQAHNDANELFRSSSNELDETITGYGNGRIDRLRKAVKEKRNEVNLGK